jgi:lactoylglutathione lyase
MSDATATKDFDPKYWLAGTDAKDRRILHTMMRVKDPETALHFYVDGLGMKLVHRYEIESKRLTAFFLSFDENSTDGFLELAHYWDADAPYSHGSGYGHIAVGVPDFYEAVAKLEAMGTEIVARPYILFAGGPKLAMVKDPDGYLVELIQAKRD